MKNHYIFKWFKSEQRIDIFDFWKTALLLYCLGVSQEIGVHMYKCTYSFMISHIVNFHVFPFWIFREINLHIHLTNVLSSSNTYNQFSTIMHGSKVYFPRFGGGLGEADMKVSTAFFFAIFILSEFKFKLNCSECQNPLNLII